MNSHSPIDNAQIADIGLLRSLSQEGRESIVREAQRVHFRKGQPVFDEGDNCQGFYIVISGLVKVHHLTAEGREMVLHLVRPGQSFGEAFAFRQGEYPMSAAAVEATDTLFLPTILVMRLLRGNPDWAESLLQTLATRLYMFTRKLQAQSLREAPQRLAAYLLHLSHMRGEPDRIILDMSRELLANMLGTARETISRTLTRLTERGAIEVNGREVHLANVELLQKIADGQEEL